MAEPKLARGIEDLPTAYNAAADLIGRNLAAGRGDKTAVIDCDGAWTYAQLADRVDRAAAMLRGMGIGREQRILLSLLDTIDFPAVFLGALKAGIIPVPLNTLLVADDLGWILEDSRAAAVFVTGEIAQGWEAAAARHPEVRFVSSRGGPWEDLGALLDAAGAYGDAADTHRDEVAFWLYTSGSTGRPKAAMHAHGSLRLTADLFGLGVVGYRTDDVTLSVAKQFFAYGLGNALTFPLAAGATVVLHKDRATPKAIGDLLRRHRVSILNGVPTFFAGFLASPDAPTRDELPALRIATSAGECLPAHVGEAFTARYGAEIIDGLGSTEMLHVYLAQAPGSVRYGCTGRAVPGYELAITDEVGLHLPPGEVGELRVRGPTAAIGYWNNRPKSRATFAGEWTRTGDKYVADADGWYSYQGRGDDMLKVGGIYVSPTEVEEAVACHEAVLEAAVVGRADAAGLVKPRAFVVLRAGRVADAALEAELKAHVKALLSPYKYPRWFEFVDELPKTATGKIQRFRLRETA